MAQQKIYSSILDQILDDNGDSREPDWDEVGLDEAKHSGEQLLKLTHGEADEKFVKGLKPVEARLHTQRTAQSGVTAVPADWRNRAAKTLTDDGVVNDVTMSLESAKGEGNYEKKEISESEIQSYIKKLLNGGETPAKVASKLKKLAELALFNHQSATDYLNRQAGILGLAYIEPNSYMNQCPATYERLKVKAGGLRAKSVKQISACQGCAHFRNVAGIGKTCGLYKLPVVANEKELLPIINKITAGVPKASKKAALIRIANRSNERVDLNNGLRGDAILRSTERVAIRTAGDRQEKVAKTITASDVKKAYAAGKTVAQIYKEASATVGTAAAGDAIRKFVAALKQEKVAINLSQIDCKFLRNKLAVSNPITGGSKCASCAFRQGMHCGMTGGTLLSFEGMNRVASNHKVAANAVQDGNQVLEEFGLNKRQQVEVDQSKRETLDVQMKNKFEVNL